MSARRPREYRKVQPTHRTGAYVGSGGYRYRAKLCLQTAESVEPGWNKKVGETDAEFSRRLPPGDHLGEHGFNCAVAIVFSGMAVEGFLNRYGVIRLGERFYGATYERLPPATKLAALLATCCGYLLAAEDEILKVTRELAELRNSLVHPKTKDVLIYGRPIDSSPPAIENARRAVLLMERFFELFLPHDPEMEFDAIHC